MGFTTGVLVCAGADGRDPGSGFKPDYSASAGISSVLGSASNSSLQPLTCPQGALGQLTEDAFELAAAGDSPSRPERRDRAVDLGDGGVFLSGCSEH